VTPGAPCAACVRFELRAEQASGLLERPGSLEGIEVIVRDRGETRAAGIFAALALRGARVGRLQSLDEAALAASDASVLDLLLLDLRDGAAGVAEMALRVKTLATELRAHAPGAAVGIEAAPLDLDPLWAHGLAPYVDFVVGPTPAPARAGGSAARWQRLAGPEAETLLGLLDATRAPGAERFIAPWPADGEIALALRSLRHALPPGLSPLPQVTVSCHGPGGAAAGECASEVFLHPGTLEAIALVRPRASAPAAWVRPGATAAWRHPLTPGDATPAALTPEPQGGGVRLDLPASQEPFLLRIAGWAGGDGRFTAGLDVLDERTLTVGEVIARHQAAAARQKRLVRRYIAEGTTVLAFQAPGLAAPVTVTADTVVYASGDATDMEQKNLRLNGADVVAIGGDGVPRLPIVEPERVARPPMAITLDEAYRYHLARRERVKGEDAYVVDFEPRDPSRPLYRGRAWIGSRGFALLRIHAAQTGLRGPIVSSEHEDEFVRVPAGADGVWLLARSETNQVYEGAGHRTPIRRVLTLARHEPEPPDFDRRLRAAHASPHVMLRDTPQGLRYLRRAPAAASDGGGQPPAGAPASRAVAGARASTVRTLALGAIVDPNIKAPLPFAGLSYLDFDFLGTGAQVNAFFAVAFAQAAVAVPSLGGTRWQLHGTAFATLAEYNDRSFRQGVEQYEENLRQRPARLSLAVVRPLSPRWRARVGYELGYTRLRRSDLTSPRFVEPVSPLVHALRLSLEGQRGPWTATAWWSPARRQRWRTWGWTGDPAGAASDASFQRFGATLERSFVLTPAALVRVEAAWMSGTGLDRFSRFGFDAFENRLRGYPSAGLRFDRGGVLRTAAAWNVAPALRLSAFADTALARDPGFGQALRGYSGVGAGMEAPLPWKALAAGEWGYGFQGRDREGGRGTHVFRITVYRIF
jgi:hypothetical protein